MKNKHSFLIGKWMITPVEIAAILGIIALTIGGLYVSIKDAVQLTQALNLSLTQTVILNQGIVNLQREVQLTRYEVTRLAGDLDHPPKPVTRFDFVKIQVNNLTTAIESPSIKFTFKDEDLALVKDIQDHSAKVEELLGDLSNAKTSQQQKPVLNELDAQLGMLETTIKQLVDRQATTQRESIIQTRDSLATSQRTSLLAVGVVILLGASVAILIRRVLSSRLEQALEADRLKGQLLANVSHELRTPLASIKGYTQLLDEEAYGSLTSEQHNTIQRVLINTTQLQGMVNNLLDRAQIEQGKISLRNEPFIPADLIKTTLSAIDILAKEKGLALTSEVGANVPKTLIGDSLRLQQILFNLTSNALKFTESGSVHVRIFLPDKSHWALQVKDTGIGISTEGQAQVFDPFWQVDSSATRQYRGSGLGLSIVKQLADLMEGTITLTSQPGQGSTFTVIFPLESKQ
jgi:signal transduction histidine kinase